MRLTISSKSSIPRTATNGPFALNGHIDLDQLRDGPEDAVGLRHGEDHHRKDLEAPDEGR